MHHIQNVEEIFKNAVKKLDKGTYVEVTNGDTNVEEPCIDVAEKLVEVTGDNASVGEPCINIEEKSGKGELVEVTSDEDDFQGSWFE